jgi:hypothetical protein
MAYHALLMSSVPKFPREKLRGQPSAYVPSFLKCASSSETSDLQIGHALFPFSLNHFVISDLQNGWPNVNPSVPGRTV